MKSYQMTGALKNAVLACAVLGLAILSLNGCEPAVSKTGNAQAALPELPVLETQTRAAVTYREYSASLEGSQDVEIRPQVSGYLQKILVDEGAFVKKGQPLFKIDGALYTEKLREAEASLQAARAKLEAAEIDLSKLAPLVAHRVISDVQLAEARAARDAASAAVAEAQAGVGTAQVNLSYTLIKAPADGYVGRIVLKPGSLVDAGAQAPLTTLSSVSRVFAYFSMSEEDFLAFKHLYPGASLPDKISRVPPVELVLADDSLYGEKGRLEAVLGSFDKTTGTISFRAVFPNAAGLLRSGNTGKIRLPRPLENDVVIPQASTYELQDKIMVYALSADGSVQGRPVTVAAASGHYYLVSDGLKAGDRIVFTGFDRLQDGMKIAPRKISLDSLLAADPL